MKLKKNFIFTLLFIIFITNNLTAQDFWKKIDNNS